MYWITQRSCKAAIAKIPVPVPTSNNDPPCQYFSKSCCCDWDNCSRLLSASTNFVGRAQLTPSWGIEYSTSYDATLHEVGTQRFAVTRDLHCWQAAFTRTFNSGGEAEYYFRLSVKDQKELFLERGSRTGSKLRVVSLPSLSFSISRRFCVHAVSPTGIAIRPPALSCATNGGGT